MRYYGSLSFLVADYAAGIGGSTRSDLYVLDLRQCYHFNSLEQLASAHVPPEDLNAGLQDQRVALTFLLDNLRKFGGDPSKVRSSEHSDAQFRAHRTMQVTIWGQVCLESLTVEPLD